MGNGGGGAYDGKPDSPPALRRVGNKLPDDDRGHCARQSRPMPGDAKRGMRVVEGAVSSAPKPDRGHSTPRRRPLGKRHPEPRARVHPVRLKLSRRQADDRLLRLQFAIIIARGNLRPCRGQSYVPVFGLLLPDRT